MTCISREWSPGAWRGVAGRGMVGARLTACCVRVCMCVWVRRNLNLFLRPSDAKEELDMKIAAQRMELERVLVEGAYTMLLSEGTNLVDAIIRSNPAYSSGNNTSMKAVRDAAERINMSTVSVCVRVLVWVGGCASTLFVADACTVCAGRFSVRCQSTISRSNR